MRLLLACIALFLAPAGALVVTDHYASAAEDEFLADARGHVATVNRIAEFYPPNVRKVRNVSAILHLKSMVTSGELVAVNVCATTDSPYRPLFEGLAGRCDQWRLLRRARRAALLSVVLTAAVFAIVLVARIKLLRWVAREEWPGDWSQWFVMRGMPFMLLGQIAVSLAGYGIYLQTATGKIVYALGILAIPFVVLFWIERRLVLAFVEPEALSAFRPKRSSMGRRRAVDRFGNE
jgi:hypothetical protein